MSLVESNDDPADYLMTALLFRDPNLLTAVLDKSENNQHILGHCLILPLLHTKSKELLEVAVRYPIVSEYLEDSLDQFQDILFDVLLLESSVIYDWAFKRCKFASKNKEYVKSRDLVKLYISEEYTKSNQHKIHNMIQTL